MPHPETAGDRRPYRRSVPLAGWHIGRWRGHSEGCSTVGTVIPPSRTTGWFPGSRAMAWESGGAWRAVGARLGAAKKKASHLCRASRDLTAMCRLPRSGAAAGRPSAARRRFNLFLIVPIVLGCPRRAVAATSENARDLQKGRAYPIKRYFRGTSHDPRKRHLGPAIRPAAQVRVGVSERHHRHQSRAAEASQDKPIATKPGEDGHDCRRRSSQVSQSTYVARRDALGSNPCS